MVRFIQDSTVLTAMQKCFEYKIFIYIYIYIYIFCGNTFMHMYFYFQALLYKIRLISDLLQVRSAATRIHSL